MLHIHLLGDLQISWHGQPVSGLHSARLQSFLAYLVLHRSARQSRYHVAFLFWPDSSEAQARNNLRKLLYDLRHTLPEADRFLTADGQTVGWRADAPVSLDVAAFEAAVALAEPAERKGDLPAIEAALREAVILYTGDLLPSCYDDWILPERERLSQAFVGALERLISALEGQRKYRDAIDYGRQILRYDPLHEATYRRLMRLHALSGDRAGALRAYHTCATVLKRELAVEPSLATREVYERLLREEAGPAPAPAAPLGVASLVGRQREWARLQTQWRVAAAGEAHLVLLIGEVGIGKTRLAEELLAWAARQGIATARATCYATEGALAYAPVVTWLRSRPFPPLDPVWRAEVARLLPELQAGQGTPTLPGSLTEAWQRQRLFEALARSLLHGGGPLLLLLDDMQWCDRETLEWLHYLLRSDAHAPWLLLGTLRSEEVAGDHPLRLLLEGLRHSGQLHEMELEPLTEAETGELAKELVGAELDPALAAALYDSSEGNPLFVVEMVRMGSAHEGAWTSERGREIMHTSLPLPPKVRTVIEARLGQLSPAAREVAEVAATIGREFTFAVLAGASDRDEEGLVGSLDELWRRRIVREQGADAYDFGHHRIREVAYAGLSSARRRLLHRRIAEALETGCGDELNPVCLQAATHYEQAGLPRRAIPHYLQAAEVAQRVYANEEAVGRYRRALSLLEAEPPGEQRTGPWREMYAQLQEGLGDVLERTGGHEEARAAYGKALARVSDADRLRRSRLHRKTGKSYEVLRAYEEASQSYDLAESNLGARPVVPDREWWQAWIEVQIDKTWLGYWQRRGGEMAKLADVVRPAVEQHGAPLQRARFYQVVVQMALERNRFRVAAETIADARASLTASQQTDDSTLQALSQFQLGFACLWRDELESGEEALHASLSLAKHTGDIVLQTRCLAYLGVLCRMRGQVEGVQDYVAQSQAAAREAALPLYVAYARANEAWVRWREGDLAAVEIHGRFALDAWQQGGHPVPFEWTARWPMLGAALSREQFSEAMAHARALLEPHQQRLPEAIEAALGDAIAAEKQGEAKRAHEHLQRAAELAWERGYL